MHIKTSGISDVGLKREGNEDYFSIEDFPGLFIVADGMGGHLAGEVASRIAVEMIIKSFQKWVEEDARETELFGTHDSSLSILGNYVSSSIRLANRIVYEMAKEYDQYHGMGTTAVVLFVTPEIIIAANVGDSPIFMVRDGNIEKLSKDHTLVAEQVEMNIMTAEEAETSPLRHVLTRNLGFAKNVEPDVFEIEPSNHDRFILCSDGLTDLVSDEEILDLVQNEDDPDRLCRRFIEMSLQRGGHDNTTVISVFLTGMKRARATPIRKIGQFFADLIIGMQKIIKKFKL
ncbi:MAG: Stp1/IreP family PP2C-type Ser/Thr phosphatase [Thermodesulfobacteriota bacterium]|nr:Stp1/IreP family PP2C-type Ser/Thr phosphatase [Thermodesulfobacteriota bacterium]